MVRKTPIICPSCSEHNGNYEDYTWMVISEDIKCKKCETILIYAHKCESNEKVV